MARPRPPPSNPNGSPLKYDPDFCGPQKHRSCTDVICLLLFVVFIAAWAAIASFGYKNGDPKRLLLPVDSYGHRCGEGDLVNQSELFYFDLTTCLNAGSIWSGCKTPQICVSTCPQEIWVANIYLISGFPFNKSDIDAHLICTDQTIVTTVTNATILKDVLDKGACASWTVPSEAFYYRCIPNLTVNYTALIDDFEKRFNYSVPFTSQLLTDAAQIVKKLDEFNQVAHDVIQDLTSTWRYLVLFAVAALVVSFVYIILLRFLAGVVTWLSIAALIALFAVGAYFSYKNYAFLNGNPNARIVPDNNSLQGQVTKIFNMWEFWAFLLVLCVVLLLLILLIVVFLRNRIYIATALIKEGSKAVSSTMTTLFFPVVPWVLQLAILLWSLGVFLYLYSTGTNAYRIEGLDSNCTCTNSYQNISNNATCTVEEFNLYCHQTGDTSSHCYTAGCTIYALQSSTIVIYLHLINLFGFFWGIWFVSGLAQMILAGAFSTWYWTFNKRHVPFFNLSRAIIRTCWYHLGTVAFGSLILAICSFIRAMLEFAERKLKKFENPVTKALLCCCQCFFWCLQKFLCFLNRNAYIMCAVHGQNFCISAKEAFQLLLRNVVRVVFVDKVTDFLFFLGKALVTASLVAVSYKLFIGQVRLLDDSGRDVELVYPWLPMVIVGIITYIVASIFFSVYSVAVDTLFLCFLEDCERNDGSVERPYFMPKQLMKILGKKNKKM